VGAVGVDVDIPDAGLDLEALERALIRKALAKAEGNVSKAARLLGLTRRTLSTGSRSCTRSSERCTGWGSRCPGGAGEAE